MSFPACPEAPKAFLSPRMADIWQQGFGDCGGLHIFGRNEQWAEVFGDTDYGGSIYGVAFAADGRLATTSYDGMIRLYDKGFRLVGPPKKGESGNTLFKIAFSPDGTKLAVGYHDVTALELFDGQSLAPLPRPNLEGLVARLRDPNGKAFGANGATMGKPSQWSAAMASHHFLREAVILKEMMKKIALSL